MIPAKNALIKYLELELPVKFKVIKNELSDIDAEYQAKFDRWGNPMGHLITVWELDCSRPLESLIAHELIHAWEFEHGIVEGLHSPEFKQMAEAIESDFGIEEIYLPGIDLD